MHIRLVTDSAADIPDDLAEASHIKVVPNALVMDGKNLVDNRDITREEFYARIPKLKTPATTATASPGDYEMAYDELLQQGAEAILSIHTASRLSGIFNAASAAALQFSGKVRVIDSGQLSLALGFQVLAAAAAIAQGLHLDAVLESLQDVRRRVRLLAMLDTLEYIRRSGRVSWARARLGSLLDIKPIIRVQEGEVQSVGNTRTRQKGIERLLELFTSQGAFEKLAVLHSNAETDARLLLSRLELHPAITPLVVNVTPIIGTHVGPNGLGFACVLKAQG